MLKKILATMASAIIATVSVHAAPYAAIPQLACDTGYGFYAAPQGGVNVFTTTGNKYGRTDYSIVSGGGYDKYSTSTKSSGGGFAGLKLGYNFKTDCLVAPAIEFDGYWVQSRLKVTTRDVYSNNGISKTTTEDFYNTRGNSFAYMLNGIARVDLGCFKPYAGVGIGFATTGWDGSSDETYTDETGKITKSHTNHLVNNVSSSTYFAVQVVAGIDYYFTTNMSVFTEYKFMNICGDASMDNLRNNIIGAGLRFHF